MQKDDVRQVIEEALDDAVSYVTPTEAAAALGKSTSTVLKWLRSGELTGSKVRDRWFVAVVRVTDDPQAPITSQRTLVR